MGQASQDQRSTVPVRDVSRMHLLGHAQPKGVHHQVPFAPIHLLGTVIPTNPPFSVVFTD